MVYYHHTDHLGTTEVVTDQNGNVVWEAGYEAFGSVLSERGDSSFTPSYTGKFFDKASGLYYFNARWYDSALGRFTSQDPIRDGTNWWNYCNGNPVRFVDWLGLEECEIELRAGHKKTVWQKIDDELTRFCYRNFVLGGSYQADGLGNKLIPTMDGRKITVSRSGEEYFSNSEKDSDRLFFLVNLFNSELGLLAKTGAFTSAAQSVGKVSDVAGAGKKIVKNAPDLSNAMKIADKSQKTIVIGENMTRVKKATKMLQQEGIDAKWYQAWKNNFPQKGVKMTQDQLTEALFRNKRWLQSKIDEGYQIIDIGKDINRMERSPFFNLEQNIIENANDLNLIKVDKF